MIITVASHKGGVGKTTTAVHLAAYLQTLAPTLLLDGDDTRNATAWSKRGPGFPFRVADEIQAARLSRDFEHTVIDTGQRPTRVDLKALCEACDLLVIPAVPASLDTDGLVLTLQALQELGSDHYRILLTRVPPHPEREGPQLLRRTYRPIDLAFHRYIPRLKAFEKAATAGVTVRDIEYDARSARGKLNQAVGKELVTYGRAK